MVDYPVAASDISETPYSGSALIKEVAWYVENSREKHPPMAKKRPNGFGLYDMSGGVREWCMDGFGTYHEKEGDNVVHHGSSRKKVCRGGAYTLREQLCRVTSRTGFEFDSGNQITGFRIARNALTSDH
jgi:formylglycine-generating enzyme required for sulfatase activity